MARKKKLPYREGSCFLIPIIEEQTIIGIVARMDGMGRIFVYFFALPPKADVNEGTIQSLRAAKAIWRGMCGDSGLLNGEWRIMGTIPNWNREAWPLPPFVQTDSVSGEQFEVRYDDQLNCVSQQPLQLGTGGGWPPDCMSGYKAVEFSVREQLGLPVTEQSHSANELQESWSEDGGYGRTEPGVYVFLRGPLHPEDVYPLEDQLIGTIEQAGCGEFDGTQIGPLGGDKSVSVGVQLFMHGPDAERLHAAIEPILRGSPLCRGARVVICPCGEVRGREYRLPE